MRARGRIADNVGLNYAMQWDHPFTVGLHAFFLLQHNVHIQMRKQNGCANKPARGTEEGFSLCPRGCMHTASRLALLKTHFSLFYSVRLAGAALRPANSAAQRDVSQFCNIILHLNCNFCLYNTSIYSFVLYTRTKYYLYMHKDFPNLTHRSLQNHHFAQSC